MMIYENKRNQDKVKVEASSLSLDAVEVTYISSNNHEAGETAFIKIGTFKRWWSLVEEVVEEADTDIKEDIIDTESELTDEEYAKIGLEIAEQAKKKVESHKLVPMLGIEKLEVYKNEVELESVITKLQDAGFTVNIVKGLSKTISIKTVGQLAISKNGFRLKANLNFEFTSETSYETTKNYNKVMCDTLEDVLKIIQ